MSYRLFPQVRDDIETIALTIAQDNPAAAGKWLTRIERAFENLGAMPLMGLPRFDVRPNLRLHTVGDYLILHRAHDEGVDIVRVVHGAREWESLI